MVSRGITRCMWFETWPEVLRTTTAAAVTYVFLVALLHLSGKRTLAKLNAFDLVVTVALGSTLATIALSAEVTITEGFAALGVLVLLQFLVAWVAARVGLFRRAVKAEPTVILTDGRLLDAEVRRQRLSPDEVLQAIRSSGIGGIELVAAVVVETDGTLSVIARGQYGSGNALPRSGDRNGR
jgi:uncharacterized membrane protein YcaP (DUF421 family)